MSRLVCRATTDSARHCALGQRRQRSTVGRRRRQKADSDEPREVQAHKLLVDTTCNAIALAGSDEERVGMAVVELWRLGRRRQVVEHKVEQREECVRLCVRTAGACLLYTSPSPRD